MEITVNKKGKSHAMALVNSGKVDTDSSWSFDKAADGDKLLGDKGVDWAEYAKWFMAEDAGAAENTKERYKYPFGKDGKVYRAGVIAAKQRAATQGETDIEAAADAVLQKIDAKAKKEAVKMSEFSFEDQRRMICDAVGDLRKQANPGMMESYPWIRDMYADRVIVEDGSELYEYPYTIADDGTVTLGNPKQVKVTYEAFAEIKGMEVLQTGTHVSQDGSSVTYTEGDLDEIKKNAETLKDVVKPPLVVGHAEGDLSELINAQTVGAPQVGFYDPATLTKKKNEDGSFSLFADVKDVAEKAVDKIGKELKRVSPEIYTNYKHGDKSYGKVLRRVSFVPLPSIKTMADVTQAHLAFGEQPDQPTTWVIFREETPQTKGKEQRKMDVIKLQEQVTELTTKMGELAGKVTTLETEKKDALAKLGEATAKITTLETEKKDAVTKLSEAQKAQRRTEIHQFCENLKRDGKLIPAMQDMGIERFMEALDDSAVQKFAEDKGDKKAEELSPLAFMKKFMESFGKIVRFGEMGGPGKGADNTDEKDRVKKRDEAIAKYREAHPGDSQAVAWKAVSSEQPELFKGEE